MSHAQDDFRSLMESVTNVIGTRIPDAALQADLNTRFPAHGDAYGRIFAACRKGIEAGWMCGREHGGIRYGRVIGPGELGGHSVDVVQMNDIDGPHHRHPDGEIDLIMPLDDGARFDGHPAGWLVYGPGSAHSPTVSGGRALVLYLLPNGSIEFTR